MTTVAYQLGPKAQPVYALEGSIAIAGAVLDWLKDNLNLMSDTKESETIVQHTPPSKITFVPAFCGLFAPYWEKDAKR